MKCKCLNLKWFIQKCLHRFIAKFKTVYITNFICPRNCFGFKRSIFIANFSSYIVFKLMVLLYQKVTVTSVFNLIKNITLIFFVCYQNVHWLCKILYVVLCCHNSKNVVQNCLKFKMLEIHINVLHLTLRKSFVTV